MSPLINGSGANTDNDNSKPGSATATEYWKFATNNGSSSELVKVGMLINDIAIDSTNGDAYFTDSFNCRELAA
jgi:hypothetical protein